MKVANKISKGISLVDESLDAQRVNDYQLLLQVGFDGLACSMVDIKKNKFLALETYTFQNSYNYQFLCENINDIVGKHPFLAKTFNNVQASVVNNKSTLIPNPLFEEDSKMDYVKFNFSLENDENIAVDNLKNLEAKNLFALSHSLENTLKKLYPSIKIIHHSTALLENLILNFKNQPDKKIIAHIQFSHFEIIVLEGKNLLFYNSFRHQTSEDFIYYLLFVYEQLKLNPETMELMLLGEVERNSAIYSILQKYIRHIKFHSRNDNFEYSYKLNSLPKHFYYNLFSQYLCV